MHYLRLSVLLVLSAALLVGPAAPLPVPSPRGDMVVKHKWDVIPDDWVSLGPPPDDSTIELHIALQPNQKNALIDVLYEVSQPGHPKYGAHLSSEQLAELIAPHPDTLELVRSWLEHNGVSPSSVSTTHGGGWLTVTDVPVPQANVLLGATYELYYHAGRNDTILRTVGYSLPAALHTHVQTIVPTTAFTSTRLLQQTSHPRSGEAAAPNAGPGEPVNTLSRRQARPIEISVLREMYGTENYVPPAAENSRLGIVGYDDEYPSLTDQSKFMRNFREDAREETVSFETIDKTLPASAGYTSHRVNMFTQYAAALTYPIPITFYRGTGKRLLPYSRNTPGPGDALQQWLKWALDENRRNNPHTIGLITEGTREDYLPQEYANAMCTLLRDLGSLGITILAASGDKGVGQDNFKKFSVNFPASCPFVTSVGGTTRKADASEVASSYSGGGFSTYFDIESFQIEHVKPYLDFLEEKNMYPGRYEPGRGVPDISAQSSHYKYIYGGKAGDLDSTACATSTAAAIFSMLNDYLISQGQGTLGWLNPWLYGTGWIGFTDIIEGNNPGCKTPGFSAIVGWDPVTGVGTPDFGTLQSIVRLTRPPQAPQPQPQPARMRRNQSFHDEP